MDPLEPKLLRRIKAAYPNLTDNDIDRFESMNSELAELTGPKNQKAALAIRAQRTAFIQEKMPNALGIFRAFDADEQNTRKKKRRKVSIRKKQVRSNESS